MGETPHEQRRSRPEFFLLVASLATTLGPGLLLVAWSGWIGTRALGGVVMIAGLVMAIVWGRRLFGEH